MDRGPHPTNAALKAALVVQLQQARHDLARETRLAQTHLSPLAIARRSFTEHKIAWIAGASLAGIALVRTLLPARNNRRDKNDQTSKKRGLRGLLSSLAMTLAKRAAMNFATAHFKDSATSYLDSLLKRQG
jgi:hypothetical protein